MSKLVPIHFGEVKNFKLNFFNLEKLQSWLASLNGRKVNITIEEPRTGRSTAQNRYYWMFLSLIESETGNAAEDIHELAKRKFLPPVFKTIMGQEVKLPASTTKLDKQEFVDYISKIEQWTGIQAPSPEEFKI